MSLLLKLLGPEEYGHLWRWSHEPRSVASGSPPSSEHPPSSSLVGLNQGAELFHQLPNAVGRCQVRVQALSRPLLFFVSGLRVGPASKLLLLCELYVFEGKGMKLSVISSGSFALSVFVLSQWPYMNNLPTGFSHLLPVSER